MFYKLHNIPISVHNREEKNKESKYDFTFYVLNMDRDKLYEKINKRVDKMISEGLLEEVKNIRNMGVDINTNAMRSIGYREINQFLDNQESDFNKVVEEIKMHTRNYAKRQLTWFRAQKNIQWIDIK